MEGEAVLEVLPCFCLTLWLERMDAQSRARCGEFIPKSRICNDCTFSARPSSVSHLHTSRIWANKCSRNVCFWCWRHARYIHAVHNAPICAHGRVCVHGEWSFSVLCPIQEEEGKSCARGDCCGGIISMSWMNAAFVCVFVCVCAHAPGTRHS